MGRYYRYFAHHKGDHIRLAYADSLAGHWKIYEPGVLNVKETEFYRPQPDPPKLPDTFYTMWLRRRSMWMTSIGSL